MKLIDKLTELYNDNSKHSNYQNVPEFVSKELGYFEKINEEWRGDTARYKYIISKLKEMKISSISDIGANTGFFILSISYLYPDIICNAYELNENYANYIRVIKNHFGLKNINIFKKEIKLSNILELDYTDVVINSNVLHHAGVDFDIELIKNIEEFNSYAIEYFKKMTKITKIMFFQMGYNWGGNKSTPLSTSGDIYRFIQRNQKLFNSAGWQILSIGIYDYNIKDYKELSHKFLDIINNKSFETKTNNEFDHWLEKIGFENNSEFYKRPIFILKRS